MTTTPASARNISPNVPPTSPRYQGLYIGPDRQLTQPLGHRLLSNDEAVLIVVDELHKAWLRFRHTHAKGDLYHFIARAAYLERLGYTIILNKRCDCVGAHKEVTACPLVH